MEGHSHALSGACAGLGIGLALRARLPADAALAGFTAGLALLPDLDKCGASAARSLGFLTEAIAWVITRASGGHRHGTHSAVGAAAFCAAAWLACRYRHDLGGKIGLALLLTVAVAAGLEALHVSSGHVADLIGIAVAVAVLWRGYFLPLIPLATAAGCVTHLLGDMLTDRGVPLAWPVSQRRFWLVPRQLAFTTGSAPERWFVVPALTLGLAVLSWQAVAPVLHLSLRL